MSTTRLPCHCGNPACERNEPAWSLIKQAVVIENLTLITRVRTAANELRRAPKMTQLLRRHLLDILEPETAADPTGRKEDSPS